MRSMNTFNKSKLLVISFFIATGFLAYSCSDSSTDPNIEPDPEIVGFVLEEGGVEVVRYMNGTYMFSDAAAVSRYVQNNQLVLSTSHEGGNLVRTSADNEEPSGRRYFTPSLEILFIFDDSDEPVSLPQERAAGVTGDVSDPSDLNPDGPWRLNVEWTNTGDNHHANIEQHGSDGSWLFHIRADYEGTTAVNFVLDRCDNIQSIESIAGENNRVDQIRNCADDEERTFTPSAPMPVMVTDYDLTDDAGMYPHTRHERQR